MVIERLTLKHPERRASSSSSSSPTIETVSNTLGIKNYRSPDEKSLWKMNNFSDQELRIAMEIAVGNLSQYYADGSRCDVEVNTGLKILKHLNNGAGAFLLDTATEQNCALAVALINVLKNIESIFKLTSTGSINFESRNKSDDLMKGLHEAANIIYSNLGSKLIEVLDQLKF